MPRLTSSILIALALLATALLGGCAYAPGLSIGRSVTSPGAQAGASADAPPPGAVTDITPDLVRQQLAAQPAGIGPDVKRLFGVAQTYTIGAGDVLGITVWDHPELATAAGGYLVSASGQVQFPYIGSTPLAGLTEQGANDLLTKRLAKYIKNPQITLSIQSYRAGSVYVDGEVRTPGLQPVNDLPMTLPVVLGRAGGLSASADRSALALTRDGTTTRINLQQLTAQGVNPANILLASGDMLRVPNRDESRIFVLGEVPRAGGQLMRNGRLTLNEALGDAGGINPTSGDPRQVYVVRNGAAGNPQIFHLDARTAVAYALAEGFELKARDVVFVDPVPLVSWNRVISLILPSASAVILTRDTVNAVSP
ncbi:polysaccharide biosynthesis/export family protein [Rhodoferax sp.]|uniref:polysaccharide biosynthesis/export family protein n=1 Tax=Rhodoferax sp. TaxID=50421 RepID=UPI0027347224|nr:polysaccharide biosynthesis/export family protein [Rhodoferax sp.]MDP3190350.1 polysaccharide biosynthesis/export family protein [Rhodoferax sp.]MDP3335423.1 polysaccharide biosynthesis/export family protein [Rhodoferax sp.]